MGRERSHAKTTREGAAMSLVIFFGFALFIFLCGVTVISVTFYHWYQQARNKPATDKSALKS